MENKLVPGKVVHTPDYKRKVFITWYRNQRPSAARLWDMIDFDEFNMSKPAQSTLMLWIKGDFEEQAALLDTQVMQELQDRMIQEKVEMLDRHARVALELQNWAMKYIEDNKDNLKVPNAVRLLVEAVRIERESRGIPQAIQKMIGKSDAELLQEVQSILSRSASDIEALE